MTTPVPASPVHDRRSLALSGLLLLLTLATTTWVGAALHGVDLAAEPARFAVGLPYALGLLFVLGVHEMGHYIAARRHGVAVSPPYFIPLPFGLGTFGAFVRLGSEPTDRRQLFDIAIAGPLAGLVASIVMLAFGRASSHSLVMAGSIGLLLTAFNLIPVGQLDGGHIARAWFGARPALWIGRAALAAMVAIGFLVWRPMLVWAVVAFAFSAVQDEADTDEHSTRDPSLGWIRRGAGAAALAALALLVPMIAGAGGPISCPMM